MTMVALIATIPPCPPPKLHHRRRACGLRIDVLDAEHLGQTGLAEATTPPLGAKGTASSFPGPLLSESGWG
jgi:hypothetical protein